MFIDLLFFLFLNDFGWLQLFYCVNIKRENRSYIISEGIKNKYVNVRICKGVKQKRDIKFLI